MLTPCTASGKRWKVEEDCGLAPDLKLLHLRVAVDQDGEETYSATTPVALQVGGQVYDA
jgi:hypothetical protein